MKQKKRPLAFQHNALANFRTLFLFFERILRAMSPFRRSVNFFVAPTFIQSSSRITMYIYIDIYKFVCTYICLRSFYHRDIPNVSSRRTSLLQIDVWIFFSTYQSRRFQQFEFLHIHRVFSIVLQIYAHFFKYKKNSQSKLHMKQTKANQRIENSKEEFAARVKVPSFDLRFSQQLPNRDEASYNYFSTPLNCQSNSISVLERLGTGKLLW